MIVKRFNLPTTLRVASTGLVHFLCVRRVDSKREREKDARDG